MCTPMYTGKNYVCCIDSNKLEIKTNFQMKLNIWQIEGAQRNRKHFEITFMVFSGLFILEVGSLDKGFV